MTFWCLNFIILLLTTTYLAYKYMARHFDYWKKRNIPFIKPKLFFGNFYETAIFKVHSSVGLKNIYDELDEPFFGFYIFDQPILMMKSRKLINDVLIKDAYNFLDRTVANPGKFSKFLFFQNNPGWKVNRVNLSRLFTPSRLKIMFYVVDDISQRLVNIITEDVVLDTRDLMDKFISEFIGKCYFGTTDNCLENDQSVFLKNITSIFKFTWRNALVQTNYFFKPALANFFKVSFTDPIILKYLRSVLLQSLKYKRSSTKTANDFIDFYYELNVKSKESNREVTEQELDEISALSINFTMASETVGSTLSYTLYELAINENIQESLRNEITEIVDQGDDISYETLNKTKLLDNCIFETIRKYPIIPHICRKALKAYTFSGTNVTIDKGTWIYIPIYALSNDDKNFPNPNQFNPDRFNDFGKKEGESYFLPFGGGPRVCIGERLAILVMKLAIMYILLNFKLEKCDGTPEKLEFEPKSFVLRSKQDLKIRIKPILK